MSKGPRRKQPTETEIIAALLIENQALRGDPIADWETLKAMTAEQIRSLFQIQHTTYNVWIEDRARQNHPTVLTPMYAKAHQEVTARKDLPTIAKVKRVSARHVNHQRELARRHGLLDTMVEELKDVAATYARLKKPKQKIKSRGFQGSRKFNGEIKWKKER
jgi:hypothetical protein